MSIIIINWRDNFDTTSPIISQISAVGYSNSRTRYIFERRCKRRCTRTHTDTLIRNVKLS